MPDQPIPWNDVYARAWAAELLGEPADEEYERLVKEATERDEDTLGRMGFHIR